jgi:hypothetical protein
VEARTLKPLPSAKVAADAHSLALGILEPHERRAGADERLQLGGHHRLRLYLAGTQRRRQRRDACDLDGSEALCNGFRAQRRLTRLLCEPSGALRVAGERGATGGGLRLGSRRAKSIAAYGADGSVPPLSRVVMAWVCQVTPDVSKEVLAALRALLRAAADAFDEPRVNGKRDAKDMEHCATVEARICMDLLPQPGCTRPLLITQLWVVERSQCVQLLIRERASRGRGEVGGNLDARSRSRS